MPKILIFCSQNSFFDHFMALIAIFVHHRRWGCLRVLTGAHGCSRVQAGAYGCSLVGANQFDIVDYILQESLNYQPASK